MQGRCVPNVARERNPERWSGDSCNGSPIQIVTLDAERRHAAVETA